MNDSDRQAMIRAYAEATNSDDVVEDLAANWPENRFQELFEIAWLTAMRYGMEQSAQICESNKLTETHIGPLFNAGWSGAITSCAAAITAAMPEK